MPLRGSLAEINVWDLLHLLRTSGGTGELIVATLDMDARLHFDDGKLVAAASRYGEGSEVLRAVLAWQDGEFEFRRVTEPPLRPDPGLDATLLTMAVAASRPWFGDNGRDRHPRPLAQVRLDDPRGQDLAWFVESHPFLEHACLLDAEGHIRAQSSTNIVRAEEVRALATILASHSRDYPRPRPRRLIVEDEAGIVVLTRLTDDSTLLLLADAKTTAGAVCSAASRFVARLEGES
ncbi:MAG TPA: DUF4388 domain-containing protein [Thermoanaerobaculaceae bacterium]|nr:DUF4388 domain-containing protein [Thermoanaerobaculaceae bacterium]HRS16383.1 DUF4388 domain-containing protein [Thermoanaerobaculaceae bacterium]